MTSRYFTEGLTGLRTPLPGPRYSPIPLSPKPSVPAAPAVVDNIKVVEIRLNAARRDLRQFRHAYGDIAELADVLAVINRYLDGAEAPGVGNIVLSEPENTTA
ncbi:MAG TPA: hypothetical protein VGG57_08260 [Stellaceae bacterium]|jgi:hypothetical protein